MPQTGIFLCFLCIFSGNFRRVGHRIPCANISCVSGGFCRRNMGRDAVSGMFRVALVLAFLCPGAVRGKLSREAMGFCATGRHATSHDDVGFHNGFPVLGRRAVWSWTPLNVQPFTALLLRIVPYANRVVCAQLLTIASRERSIRMLCRLHV